MSTKRTEPPSPSGPPRPNKMANTDAETAPPPPPAPVSHLLIKRLSEKAKLPTRGSALAAGYDLAEQKIIPARGKALVDTQISIAVPVGTYGRVAPRSGLASKFMIDTGAGVIDADYRGVVFVLLFNHSDKDFQVEEGDRVAQLIIEKIQTPEVMEVEDLEETLRGAGGFGSTGGHVSAKLAETLHLDQEFLDACADIAGEYESQPFFSPTGILVSPTAVSSGKASLLSDIAPKTPRLTGDYPYAYSDFYGSGTACVFKSGPPWPVRMGPEAYGIVREPRPVYGHPIGPTWLSVGRRICDELDFMAITWTCINPLAYADAGQARPFCPLILSIGVIPGSLHYDTAVVAAASIKNILAGHVFGTIDIEVAFVEWVVARSAGRKLLPFDPLFDRVPDLRKPFTSTLGLSIAPVKYPHYEGTAALYFRLSKDDNRVAVLTCAHVARPPPAYAANTAIMRKKSRQPREVFVALGHQAYANAIDAMTGATHNITSSIDKWNNALRRLGERIEGENSNTTEAREERQRLVAKALKDIEEANKLHDEVTKFRTTPSQRIIGFLLHSEPIEVSVEPHGYTKDWALIELYDDKVDWSTFKGNKVYVGGELSVPDFRNTMFPHRTDRATYQYPEDGLLQAHGIVEDSEIRNPQHLDAYGNKCLPVVKNGSATGTTVGLVNGLESFTRSYSEYGISQTSVEFAVVASPKTRARFSDVGDSGSIVLARDGRIVGILTGGAGSPDETDVTYLTPYWWIEEQINAKYPGAFLHDVVQ